MYDTDVFIVLFTLFVHKRMNNSYDTVPFWGMAFPCKKCRNNMSACRGRCRGTSCPAPRTVTKVRPLYTWLQPPTTYLKIVRKWLYKASDVNLWYIYVDTWVIWTMTVNVAMIEKFLSWGSSEEVELFYRKWWRQLEWNEADLVVLIPRIPACGSW